MSIPILTEKQAEALKAVTAGRVTMRNAGTAAYRIRGASPQVIGKLISLQLARWPKGPVGEQTCETTPDGMLALMTIA